jgi:predicted translin family RNA/ssDNA-binding protein
MSNVPTFPESPLNAFGITLIDAEIFDGVRNELEAKVTKREGTSKVANELSGLIDRATEAMLAGERDDADAATNEACAKAASAMVEVCGPCTQIREGYLNSCFPRLATVLVLRTFLFTGELLSLSAANALLGREGAAFDDSEYLGGLMSAVQLTGQYASTRAAKLDTRSIALCHRFVDALQSKFVEFDFRNGPVRRKYDGVKYVVRQLEDTLFELSLVEQGAGGDGPPAKRARVDGAATDAAAADAPPAPLSAATTAALGEIDAIRERNAAYDKLREQVIKRTRDVQKLSKNAVYSLHRGDAAKCAAQLAEAREKAIGIFVDAIAEQPALRNGSFANAMEEYAEARLYEGWLANRRIMSPAEICAVGAAPPSGGGAASAGGGAVDGKEGRPGESDFCDTAAYIGALVDFTGEVGRFAVARATKRDFAAVEECLQTDVALALRILPMRGIIPKKLGKKMSELERNRKKVHVLNYELALVRRGRGGKRPSAMATDAPKGGDGGGDDE